MEFHGIGFNLWNDGKSGIKGCLITKDCVGLWLSKDKILITETKSKVKSYENPHLKFGRT